MTAAAMLTINIIKYWSLWAVPPAILLFVLPCRLRTRGQACWIMFLLLCGVKGLAYEALGGSALTPELPEPLVWLWNWASGGLFILVLLSAVWWVRKGRAWILPILSWGLALWGQICGTIAPSVREIELAFPGLPPALEGYRIVQLTDIHCSSAARRWRTQAIVDRVNALDADLVCLTGDYVDGRLSYLAADLAPLKNLRGRDGVYGVRGNHEYYGDSLRWRDWLARQGLRMLSNECVFPRRELALGGVNDLVAARYGDAAPDVAAAFAAATNGEFRVLMQHRPGLATLNFAKHGVALQLSGHTHGGIAPLLDRIVAGHNHGYVRGIYRADGGVLHVSPGCGQWAGFPMRFFNPPEITVITLRRSQRSDERLR